MFDNVENYFYLFPGEVALKCNTKLFCNLNIVINSVLKNVGFEVLIAVVMKSPIFWDKMPCSPLQVNRRFGGTYRLHLQNLRISREK
jgi:hypothetical protein